MKKRRESQGSECSLWGEKSWLATPTNHIAGRGVSWPNARRRSSITHLKRKMDDDEKSLSDSQDVSQSEEKSSNQKIRSKTQRGETWQRCRRRSIKTGAAPSQHTRAEGGVNMVVKNKKEEEKKLLKEEGGLKRRCTEEQRKDELMVQEEAQTRVTEQAGRLRRKMVGPPVRYLLESESWSHGQSAANLCKASGVKDQESEDDEMEEEEEKEERRGGSELTERTDSSRVDSSEDEGVGGGLQICQVRAFHQDFQIMKSPQC